MTTIFPFSNNVSEMLLLHRLDMSEVCVQELKIEIANSTESFSNLWTKLVIMVNSFNIYINCKSLFVRDFFFLVIFVSQQTMFYMFFGQRIISIYQAMSLFVRSGSIFTNHSEELLSLILKINVFFFF